MLKIIKSTFSHFAGLLGGTPLPCVLIKLKKGEKDADMETCFKKVEWNIR